MQRFLEVLSTLFFVKATVPAELQDQSRRMHKQTHTDLELGMLTQRLTLHI